MALGMALHMALDIPLGMVIDMEFLVRKGECCVFGILDFRIAGNVDHHCICEPSWMVFSHHTIQKPDALETDSKACE